MVIRRFWLFYKNAIWRALQLEMEKYADVDEKALLSFDIESVTRIDVYCFSGWKEPHPVSFVVFYKYGEIIGCNTPRFGNYNKNTIKDEFISKVPGNGHKLL